MSGPFPTKKDYGRTYLGTYEVLLLGWSAWAWENWPPHSVSSIQLQNMARLNRRNNTTMKVLYYYYHHASCAVTSNRTDTQQHLFFHGEGIPFSVNLQALGPSASTRLLSLSKHTQSTQASCTLILAIICNH